MTTRLNEVANTGFRLDMVQALFGSCSWVVFNIFQLVCLVCVLCEIPFHGRIEKQQDPIMWV